MIISKVKRTKNIDKINRMKIIDEMIRYYNLNVNVEFGFPGMFSAYKRKIQKNGGKRKIRKILNKGRLYNVKDEKIYAEYVFSENKIIINPKETTSNQDFLLTILHELKHVEQSKKLGSNKFESEYFKHMDLYEQDNQDGYGTNPFEREAETWAHSELSKWLDKL